MTLDPIQALNWKLWRESILVALGAFAFWLVYIFFLDGYVALENVSKALVGSSGTLLSAALGLGSAAYYFPVFGKKVVYRKYLGLLGYYFSLADGALLVFLNPDRYFYHFFDNFWTGDVFFGFIAMAILTMMALISNKPLIPIIGAQRWRNLLRLGFVALFFLMLRAIVIEGETWLPWLSMPSGLPPVRLVLSLLVTLVLFTRLSLVFHKWRKKPDMPAATPTVPPVA